MKTFAYASLGVLALAAAFHLGAATATTSIVDHSASGLVAAEWRNYENINVLDENGVEWSVTTSTWHENPDGMCPLPVGVEEVKFWEWNALVTYDDHVWIFGSGQWVDCGAWPSGATATERGSWGSVKAKFR